MLLKFCLDHHAEWNPEVSRAALADTEEVLLRSAPPFAGLRAAHVQSLLWSQLYCQTRARGERVLDLPDPFVIPMLRTIEAPSSAEYARLISKARLIYEHCMTEVSHAAVASFMGHELQRDRRSRRVVFDLVAWMVEQRLGLVDLGSDEDCDVDERLNQTDYMIDLGVSLVHGLALDEARQLAADLEP